MNKQNYTSQELSKWLAENGCTLESEYYWCNTIGQPDQRCWRLGEDESLEDTAMECYPAFDTLNDICCKYTREFFGYIHDGSRKKSKKVLSYLMLGMKQEAEEYIKTHCLFNPTNK